MCEAMSAIAATTAIAGLGYSIYNGERQAKIAKQGMEDQKNSLNKQEQAMKEQAAAAPQVAQDASDDFAKQEKMKRFRAGMQETVKTNPLASSTTASTQSASSVVSAGTKDKLGA